MNERDEHGLATLDDSKLIMRGIACVMLRLGAPDEDTERYKAIRNELRRRGGPDFCCHQCFSDVHGENSTAIWK